MALKMVSHCPAFVGDVLAFLIKSSMCSPSKGGIFQNPINSFYRNINIWILSWYDQTGHCERYDIYLKIRLTAGVGQIYQFKDMTMNNWINRYDYKDILMMIYKDIMIIL